MVPPRLRKPLLVFLVLLAIILYTSFSGSPPIVEPPPPQSTSTDKSVTFSYDEQLDAFGRRWVGGPYPYEQRPDYARFDQAEISLPQHNLSLPYPEGATGKYVIFRNQIRGLGWNNVLGEILLSHHLAYRTGRAYIFQYYFWKPEYYPWRIPDSPWPINPLSTLIGGPTAGGPFAPGDKSPRAVKEEWWPMVCNKRSDIETIDTDIAKEPVFWSEGRVILEHWVKLIKDSPKRCVEIVPSRSRKDNYPQTFDLWMIGDGRALSIWEEFRDSPISQLLTTSPLVQSAIERNALLFYPKHLHGKKVKAAYGYDPFEHMMAVHIRRGDYINACTQLANTNSSFYGWNLLPELPDPFTAPPNVFSDQKAPADHIAFYHRRCLPTNEYILTKIEDSRKAWEETIGSQHGGIKLEILYLMTNAKDEWIAEFKKSLLSRNRYGRRTWVHMVTTKELDLDVEQRGVHMAVDMEIGRKAAVYIGNGWSSMTSNILHRRLVDGKKPLANRFW